MIILEKTNKIKIIIHIYSLEELNILTNLSIEVALKPLHCCIFLHLHYTTKQMILIIVNGA